MTITARDQLINSIGNTSSRVVVDKASITSANGFYASFWRATGQPGQGAIPTSVEVCDHTFAGAPAFPQQTSPATSYAGWGHISSAQSGVAIEWHDRLAHMGGLSGTVTTAQTVGIDLSTLAATSNLDERKGDANHSDVQWWLEWYTNTGATSVTATVNVTYDDGTTGNLTGQSLSSSVNVNRLMPLNGLIPSGTAKYIRGVNSVTLSASTGTAGNFGVTATRPRTIMPVATANKQEVFDWAALGFPQIYNSSCMMLIMFSTGTTMGPIRGGLKIAHG